MRSASLLSLALLAAASSLAACEAPHAAAGPAKHAPITVGVVDDWPSETEIAAQIAGWRDAVRAGDAQAVAALYGDTAVLMPALSDQHCVGRAAIAESYERFLTLRPKPELIDQRIALLDRSTAIASGTIVYDIVREGRASFLVTRSLFVLEKAEKGWVIAAQHASPTPNQPDTRPEPKLPTQSDD